MDHSVVITMYVFSFLFMCDFSIMYGCISWLFLLISGSLPSVLWYCWLGSRKGIQPVKTWVPVWLSIWGQVQICIWPSWCRCHSLSLASVKSRLVLVLAHPGNNGRSPEGRKMCECGWVGAMDSYRCLMKALQSCSVWVDMIVIALYVLCWASLPLTLLPADPDVLPVTESMPLNLDFGVISAVTHDPRPVVQCWHRWTTASKQTLCWAK